VKCQQEERRPVLFRERLEAFQLPVVPVQVRPVVAPVRRVVALVRPVARRQVVLAPGSSVRLPLVVRPAAEAVVDQAVAAAAFGQTHSTR
jgi:hypothetical protein